MAHRKYIAFFLLLCFFFTIIFSMVKADNTNLGVIPNDWGGYNVFGDIRYTSVSPPSEPQIVYYDVNPDHERTVGAGSAYIGIYVSPSENTAHEIDGEWRSVSPGDNITFTCWIKTSTNSSAYTFGGARIGIDFYDTHLISAKASSGSEFYPDVSPEENNAFYVPYSTSSWTQRTITFTVPSQVESDGSYYPDHELHTPTGIIPWMQVWDSNTTYNLGEAWFADAIVQINPTLDPTPTPIPTPTPTITPTATPTISTAQAATNQVFTNMWAALGIIVISTLIAGAFIIVSSLNNDGEHLGSGAALIVVSLIEALIGIVVINAFQGSMGTVAVIFLITI